MHFQYLVDHYKFKSQLQAHWIMDRLGLTIENTLDMVKLCILIVCKFVSLPRISNPPGKQGSRGKKCAGFLRVSFTKWQRLLKEPDLLSSSTRPFHVGNFLYFPTLCRQCIHTLSTSDDYQRSINAKTKDDLTNFWKDNKAKMTESCDSLCYANPKYKMPAFQVSSQMSELECVCVYMLSMNKVHLKKVFILQRYVCLFIIHISF